MLSRTLRQPEVLGDALGYARVIDAPFSTIEVRMVPENVTDLPKIEQKALTPLIEERDVVLRKGETLETALRSYGANPEQIAAISGALSAGSRFRHGRRAAPAHPHRSRPAPGRSQADRRVIAFGEKGVEGIAATNDRGIFVSVTPPADPANPAEQRDCRGRGRRGRTRRHPSLRESL